MKNLNTKQDSKSLNPGTPSLSKDKSPLESTLEKKKKKFFFIKYTSNSEITDNIANTGKAKILDLDNLVR